MRVPFSKESVAQAMKKLLLTAIAASFLTAACVSTEGPVNESVADREYATGSNIPRKKHSPPPSGVTITDREEMERARDITIPPPPPRGRSSP
jgi:hypothetical protein